MINRVAVLLALEVLFDRTDEIAMSLTYAQCKALRVHDSDSQCAEAVRRACREFLAEMICPTARDLDEPEFKPFRPYSADWEC